MTKVTTIILQNLCKKLHSKIIFNVTTILQNLRTNEQKNSKIINNKSYDNITNLAQKITKKLIKIT